MNNIKLEQFIDQVLLSKDDSFQSYSDFPKNLRISQNSQYETYYAPFEFINQKAKVVIVGITPGMQQARNALLKARDVLAAGGSIELAKKEAKVFASFSGAMRKNLTEMMDHILLNKYLGIESTKSLFNKDEGLVHFTSVLRYPVFKNQKNFNDSPLKLKEQILAWFAEECKLLSDAVFVPLGSKAAEGLDLMVNHKILQPEQVLSGLQHPSGANAERISYFLGRKDRSTLSIKTNPNIIDTSKQALLKKMDFLLSAG